MTDTELDRDARTALYDNNAAVSDSAELIAGRDERAKTFRAEHDDHLDVAYGPGDNERWDFYPSSRPDAPCLVFIHGGYWQRNGRQQFAHLATGVRSAGWSFAALGYPLAPTASMSDIVRSVRTALDWLKHNGSRHGASGPIILSGWSAGAHLVALGLDHPAVAAGLAISGIYDLGPISRTRIGDALGLTATEIEDYSPLRHPPASKPLTIAYGQNELRRLIDDSTALHDARLRAGASSALIEVQNSDHFRILDELESPTGVLTRAALALHGGLDDKR